MAKAIDHNIGSTVATVGSETAKGALGGVALFGVGGAILAAGVASIFLPVLSAGVLIAAIGGGIASSIMGFYTGATLGGIVGLFSGVSKVTQEKSAFDVRMQRPNTILEAREQAAQLQQAYLAGAHDGQAQLIQQIQASQEAQTSAHAQRELERRAAAAQAVGTAKGA